MCRLNFENFSFLQCMVVGVVGVLGRAVVIPVEEAQASAIAPAQIHLLILAGKAVVLITTSPRNVL